MNGEWPEKTSQDWKVARATAGAACNFSAQNTRLFEDLMAWLGQAVLETGDFQIPSSFFEKGTWHINGELVGGFNSSEKY